MWLLARRTVFKERARLALSVAGVAVAVVLMLSLSGVYQSYQRRIADFFASVPADIWVVQSGTANFFHSSSILPAGAERDLAAIEGVAAVEPLVIRQVMFDAGGSRSLTNVVGVPEGGSLPGSVRLVRGSGAPAKAEIVLDRTLANEAELDVGDTVSLRGVSFRVAGIVSGADMVMYSYSFASLPDVLDLQGTSDVVNFYLLQLESNASTDAVVGDVPHTVEGSEAWSAGRVVEENAAVLESTFLPVIRVILVIGFIVGTAVIGLTTYSAILERRREYGVMKAIGAGPRVTFELVLEQAAISGVIGAVVGIVVSVAVARWIPSLIPQFSMSIGILDVSWILLAVAGMILTSVIVPVRRLSHIDPAEVFSS